MFKQYGAESFKNCDISSLRVLGSVGEIIDAPTWLWHNKEIGKTSFRTDKTKCLHYYFYFIDKVYGLCFFKVPGMTTSVTTQPGRCPLATRQMLPSSMNMSVPVFMSNTSPE